MGRLALVALAVGLLLGYLWGTSNDQVDAGPTRTGTTTPEGRP